MRINNVKGVRIYDHTAQDDDVTFSLSNKMSVADTVKTFNIFSFFSGQKPNKSTDGVARSGSLTGVKIGPHGMEKRTCLTAQESRYLRSLTHTCLLELYKGS